MNKNKKESKAKEGMPLHQFIATGGKPKDYKGTKGVSNETIPNIKRTK